MPERLRIFFFSDWRIQPIDWVEAMLADAGNVDLIVYGGDDLSRFLPPNRAPDDVRAALTEVTTAAFRARVKSRTATPDEVAALMRRRYGWGHSRDITRPPWRAIGLTANETLWRRWEGDPNEFLEVAVRLSRQRPPDDITRFDLPRTVEEALQLLYLDYDQSRLEQLAHRARHGLVGIAGNDCLPRHRRVLRSSHVTDLHEHPTSIEGWGFTGIEGAITFGRSSDDPEDRNALGYILHSDRSAARHLAEQVKRLGAPYNRLVVVSHTPPKGVLDTALRFGVGRRGSPMLRRFVDRHQPALVLTGHCHSSGRRSRLLGRTLVVNGASDDTKAKQCAAALIDLSASQPPDVQWLTPVRHSVLFMPGVGPKRSARLNEAGVQTLSQLLDAPPELIRKIGLSSRKVEAFKEALATNMPVWIKHKQVRLPELALFYDVETGLGVARKRDWIPEPHHPWMIGAMVEGSDHVHQWVALDPMDKASRRRMYKQFFEFVEAHPAHMLCTWSGVGFDKNAVWDGLGRYWPRRVNWWVERAEVDVLRSGVRRRVVFPCHNWSLKTIATALEFNGFDDPEMDGFEVGLRYELYCALGEEMPLERILRYNASDIRALAHFVAWFRVNQPEQLTQSSLEVAAWEPPEERPLALLIGDDPEVVSGHRRRLSPSYIVVAGRPEEAPVSLPRSPDLVFVCGVESEDRIRAVIESVLASDVTSACTIVVLDGPQLEDRLGGFGQAIWRSATSRAAFGASAATQLVLGRR